MWTGNAACPDEADAKNVIFHPEGIFIKDSKRRTYTELH
jgi:hypothetical protein